MAGNLKRIEQTQKALAEELSALGDRFHNAYESYFQALAPAVEQQLIVAAYHLCTRGYPDRFLERSVSDRAALQTKIQELARQAREQFEHFLDDDDEPDDEPVSQEWGAEDREAEMSDGERGDVVDADVTRDPASRDEESSDEVTAIAPEPPISLRDLSAAHLTDLANLTDLSMLRGSEIREEQRDTESEPGGREEEINRADGADSAPRPSLTPEKAQLLALVLQARLQAEMKEDEEDENVATPNNLLMWQRAVEGDIMKTLQDVSRQANQLMHCYDVLPREFPIGLLDAIGQGGETVEAPSGTPNLLQLRIEVGDGDDDEKMRLRILAINLRLPEIEFSEASVSQPRHTIRKLLAELSGLRKRYAANQREYTIAKAEAAWRSTWSDRRE